MTMRTTSETVEFTRPFSLRGIDEIQPAGNYLVKTDEELIEGLSFIAYRRTLTTIVLPSLSRPSSKIEVVPIDPADLKAARERDAAAI
jgi:hypothetical protein